MNFRKNITNKTNFYKMIFLVLCIMLVVTIFFSSIIGVADIKVWESVRIIISKIPGLRKFITSETLNKTHKMIILNLRIPRILGAGLVGGGLSVVGASLQAVFKNPMVDPYVLGVSSGAALGAVVANILGTKLLFGMGSMTVMAFVGAVSAISLVWIISSDNSGRMHTTTLLLTGTALSFLLTSITSGIIILSKNGAFKILAWTMGSFTSISWNQVLIIFFVVIIGTGIIIYFSKDLNIMLLGEQTAQTLGVKVERVKKVVLAVSSMIVATCVSISGIIGFVGLIVPHIIRMLFTPNHKVLIPFSIIIGAIFMIVSDTIGRSVFFPTEIPVGIVTSIFGVPYFIYLIIRNKNARGFA